MRRVTGFPLAIMVVLTVLMTSAGADEEKVPLDKVPKAVMAAVKAKFPRARLLGASTEKEKDKTVYEISLIYEKRHHDVTVEPEGKIVSIEREISSTELPKAIRQAVAARYPRSSYNRVEELLKGDGTLHAYEVLLLTAEKDSVEVVLDLKGKILKEETKKKKEKGEK
jgi:hypothetical protein